MVTIPTRARVDLTSPRSLSSLELSTVRRGFDRDEVRAVLDQVADELQRLREQNERLTEQLADARSAPAPELDESTVAGLLGEEAARVLATAKEGAVQIRNKADEGAERLLRDARDDVARMREDAAMDVSQMRAQAHADAAAEIEAAKSQGREMVAEARAVRERMLTDLARRRDAARAQLERLRADRDRLVQSFEDAGRAVDGVLGDLRDVVPAPELLDVETVEEAAAAVAALAEPPEPAVVLELVEQGHDEAEEPEEEPVEPVVLELVTNDEDPVAFHLGEEPEAPEPSLSYAGELDATPEARTDVDDLFARIRAAGPAEVAAEVERDEAADDEDEDLPPDAAYLRDRADAIDPVRASVARHVKRALNDEQNEVLDALRRSTAPGDVEALVGSPEQHAARYRRALTPDVRTAMAAGARSMGAEAEPSADVVDMLLGEIDVELVAPLRERLAKALEDAAGDTVEASATLRAAYREWRMQRADEAAGAPRAPRPRPWRLRRRRRGHAHPLGRGPRGSAVPRRGRQRAGRRRRRRRAVPHRSLSCPGAPGVLLRNRSDPGLASPAVRVPSDLPRDKRRGRRRMSNRGRIVIIVVAVLVVVLFLSARGIAGFYTDKLWFDALGQSDVFWGVIGAKVAPGRHLHRLVRHVAGAQPLDRRPHGAEGAAAGTGGAVHRAVPADRRAAGMGVPHRRRPAVRSRRRRAGVEPVEGLDPLHPQRAASARRTPSSASTSASTSSSCRS